MSGALAGDRDSTARQPDGHEAPMPRASFLRLMPLLLLLPGGLCAWPRDPAPALKDRASCPDPAVLFREQPASTLPANRIIRPGGAFQAGKTRFFLKFCCRCRPAQRFSYILDRFTAPGRSLPVATDPLQKR